jgi:hypothetical protein
MLSELQSLAALASSLPDISVETGEPGGPWSFNWATRVITVDPADLTLRPPDYCRGLILHEAAHGAITRIGDIVPKDMMRDEPGLHHLLNVVEDCRIENWLRQRFPGCRPWVRLYNDRLLASPYSDHSRSKLASDPAGGFLIGLLSEWWQEKQCCELHPLSLAAIAEVKPYFDPAVAAFPEPLPANAFKVRRLYETHPVAACYRGADRDQAPTPEECVIRMTQHRMWTLTWAHIVPVFRRLLDHPGSEPTREMLARNAASQARSVQHSGIPASGTGEDGGDPDSSKRSDQPYNKAVARHGGLIESCAEVVLRQLIDKSRPKTTRFHRSGNQLDLRVAMQFEADPRQYERLFQRRTLPSHPDPAFIIVADESASMDGERAKATFEAVVVLREVCLRLGIPLAILGFGSRTRRIQDWDDEDSSDVRGMVAGLLDPTGGSTRLQGALDGAMGLEMRLPALCQPRIWILSDGEVANPNQVRRSIIGFRMGGTPVHCIGLGPDSHGLTKIIPKAAVGIHPEDLPRVFAEMLQAQVA